MDTIDTLSESLDTEIKGWLNLDDPKDVAVFAKVCIAMRNNDGGRVVLGIDDKTLRSQDEGRPINLASAYHIDKINAVVGNYAEPRFEIRLNIKSYQSHQHPEIVIPGGIEFPVITKRPFDAGIRQSAVYIRTLSNGRPSTCEPVRSEDWQALVNKCFDNREADIGRFFRRHLSGIRSELHTGQSIGYNESAHLTESERFLRSGRQRFEEAWNSKGRVLVGDSDIQFHGFFETAACIVSGRAQKIGLSELLDTLFVRQPHLTGWPPWLDSRNSHNVQARPYIKGPGWEAIIPRVPENWQAGHVASIDFWRIEPSAHFYLLRTFETDTAESVLETGIHPGQVFDWYLLLRRTAEVIATAKVFAEALAETSQGTALHFTFRWTGLKGRSLCCLSDLSRDGIGGHPPEDDEATVIRVIPLEKANSSLWEDVSVVTQAVLDRFGVRLDESAIRDIVEKTLQRKR